MVRLPNANRWGTVQIPFPVPVNRPFNYDATAPWFFHTVLAQLAELRSPRCVYSIARTFKASRRSCRPLQNRRRCREWPKTMQRKTEKPHEYSFSEHPCGFMAWSRIRDSNPPPTAWEAVALPDELTLQVLIYISRFCWLCQQVSGRDFRLFGFWGRSAPENRWIYRPEMKKSFSFDGFMVYCAI